MDMVIAAYRWRDDARDGLEALVQQDNQAAMAKAALRAMDEERELPPGFE